MKRRLAGWRLAIAAIALLALLAFLLLTIHAIGALLNVWQQLHGVAPWLASVYGGVLALFAAAAIAVLVWLFKPAESNDPAQPPPIPSEQELRARIDHQAIGGVNTGEAEAELRELSRRREGAEVFVAMYGEVGSGKSALIRALVPGAETISDVRAGTTRSVTEYHWQSARGDGLRIADVPGFNEAGMQQNPALTEAVRAHIVVYVCEGDLSRSQYRELNALLEFGKPLLLALNKSDRYSPEDLTRIREHLKTRLPDAGDIPVIPVQAGGEEELIERDVDGAEKLMTRTRRPRIDALAKALQATLDRDAAMLTRLRDDAVFLLAARKLDRAVGEHHRRGAEKLVEKYTRRAVVGAMAAITPGSDLIIQGALATQFIRELCTLFDVPVRELEIEATLRATNMKLRKSFGLVLAVAGNALKAFPGIGTVTGGLMHAVAYGLLFDTLGRALADTLATRGQLRPQPTAVRFEEILGENLGSRALRLARVALEHRPRDENARG